MITIEKAGEHHLAGIVELLTAGAAGARAGREAADWQVYLPAFRAISGAPETDIYVALTGTGEIAGTYQITFLKGLAFQGRSRAELESVHTRTDLRGRGIGKRMMEHAEALARAEHACLIQLTSNRVREDAHRFYTRLGFEQSHLGFKKLLI